MEKRTKKELDFLKKKYKKREKDTILYQHKKNQYLAIRLDGVRFTYKYSRKEFIPKFMNLMIKNSILNTYKIIFNKHKNKNKNLILAIIQVNDEVTFILNKGENKFNRRILKPLTLVNGLMSSWSTNILINSNKNSKIEYYDARTIMLNDISEVYEYLNSRYLIAKKHALAKTLKFNSIDIKPHIWENIFLSEKMVNKYKLKEEFYKIENTFLLYIPNEKYDLKHYILTKKYIEEELKKMIIKSDNQLCELKKINNHNIKLI